MRNITNFIVMIFWVSLDMILKGILAIILVPFVILFMYLCFKVAVFSIEILT